MEAYLVCGVCGDKALNVNFGSRSCESCKAFFRRNALRNKVFRCITGGNCVLNTKTRKYCRKCRLEKCLAIGMKKEWILTDEEKALKRRRHRHYAFERSVADSTGNESKAESHTTSNNIIILPILPLSLAGGDAGRSVSPGSLLSGLDKGDIIKYINAKFSLQLDSSQFNLQVDGSKASGTDKEEDNNDGSDESDANHKQQQRNSMSNNNIFICGPDALQELNQSGKALSNSVATENNNNNNNPNDSYYYNNMPAENGSYLTSGSSSTVPTNMYGQAMGSNFETSADYYNQQQQQQTGEQLPMFAGETNYNNPSTSSGQYDASASMNAPMESDDLAYGLPSGWLPNGSSKWGDGISNDIYYHAIQLEYTTNPLKDEHGNRSLQRLNLLEQKRLDELNSHLVALYKKDQPSSTDNNRKVVVNSIEGTMELYEYVIKKIIMAIKNIPSFRALCQDDQIILLKSSVSGIKTLMNIHYFDKTQNCCLLPNPMDPQSILVIDQDYLRRTYGEGLYNKCHTFISSFRDDWKFDENILNLMGMILLFFPKRPNLTHREYVKLEYLTYCHLLQRYLEVKYNSVCEAKTVYINLMSRLYEMHDLNEQCVELMLKLDHKYIGPLTSELYDLNMRQHSRNPSGNEDHITTDIHTQPPPPPPPPPTSTPSCDL